MNIVRLVVVPLLFAGCLHPLKAESSPITVCDALNAAANREVVIIHAPVAVTRHGTFLIEGAGQEPCPDGRKHFLTAPALIPLIIGKYPGIPVPDSLYRENFDFVQRLRNSSRPGQPIWPIVTVSGVIVRKRWPLIFRFENDYWYWGNGLEDRFAAILIATSTLVEDH